METISINDSCGGSATSSSNLSNSISNTSSNSSTENESKTNLIVNYLPQSMTNDELKMIFASIGEIESCKLVKNKLNNQSLCFGFINYVHLEDAEKAIRSLNGLKIQNKIIKVSYARPSSDLIKGANLYVSGIPKHWSADDLRTYFSYCGRIITSRILFNPADRSQSKGVGFVRFDLKREAESAIARFNGHVPYVGNGVIAEPMVVKYACFANSSAARDNAKLIAQASLPLSAMNYHLNSAKLTIPSSIGHLQCQLPAQQPIANLLNSGNANTVNNHFKTAAGLQQIQPMQLSTVGTNSLANSFQLYRNDFIGNNGGGDASQANAVIQQAVASMFPATVVASTNAVVNTSATSGWCIFVYNLAPETDDACLWQLFGPFGAVQNVKIIRNFANNKCKGYGFVTMSLYDDAFNAINSLNGFNLHNRPLQVSFKTN